mmetsp:Transcript_38833/g.72192  ORF Transcript_38833/g.72192 Transcript_38833/m.72192 type:complete len:121 (-) Transcript_38833:67-429(-)
MCKSIQLPATGSDHLELSSGHKDATEATDSKASAEPSTPVSAGEEKRLERLFGPEGVPLAPKPWRGVALRENVDAVDAVDAVDLWPLGSFDIPELLAFLAAPPFSQELQKHGDMGAPVTD